MGAEPRPASLEKTPRPTPFWMVCMMVIPTAPFVAMGFITYNGMTAEQFAWTWVKSKFIEPQKVKFECDTFYHETMQNQTAQKSAKKEEKAL